jgi:hypothetical protein
MLISASSSDREFDAISLRKQIPFYTNPHQDVRVGKILLINSGFPINFDEFYLDSVEFQLTRSLLLTSIFQAIKFNFVNQDPDFIALSKQEEIIREYSKLNIDSEANDLKITPYEIEFYKGEDLNE